MAIQETDPPSDSLAYGIDQFCRDINISRRTYHNLAKQGLAPPTIRIGRRVLIRRGAAEQWLRDRERQAA